MARGRHARSAAERVHFQPGIVGQNQNPGQDPARGHRLDRGILCKRHASLRRLGKMRMIVEVFDDPAGAEHGADFLRLVSVAGGDKKRSHAHP